MSASTPSLSIVAGAALAIGCLRASNVDAFADLAAAPSLRPQVLSSSDPFADLDALRAPNPLLPPPGAGPDPATGAVMAGDADPFGDLDAAASGKSLPASSSDPFGDLGNSGVAQPLPPAPGVGSGQPTSALASTLKDDMETSFLGRLMGEGFSFKKEVMVEVSRGSLAADTPDAFNRSPSVARSASDPAIINTLRYGGDLRWRHPVTTHNLALGYNADRIFTLEDGRIVKEENGGVAAP